MRSTGSSRLVARVQSSLTGSGIPDLLCDRPRTRVIRSDPVFVDEAALAVGFFVACRGLLTDQRGRRIEGGRRPLVANSIEVFLACWLVSGSSFKMSLF